MSEDSLGRTRIEKVGVVFEQAMQFASTVSEIDHQVVLCCHSLRHTQALDFQTCGHRRA